MDLASLQARMDDVYGERDRERGIDATVAWLAEELGELARAARKGSTAEQLHELGDVLAWLASLANQLGLSLADAVARYGSGCPKCGATPCACPPVRHRRRGTTMPAGPRPGPEHPPDPER